MNKPTKTNLIPSNEVESHSWQPQTGYQFAYSLNYYTNLTCKNLYSSLHYTRMDNIFLSQKTVEVHAASMHVESIGNRSCRYRLQSTMVCCSRIPAIFSSHFLIKVVNLDLESPGAKVAPSSRAAFAV